MNQNTFIFQQTKKNKSQSDLIHPTRTIEMTLAPFSTQKFEYFFYFPKPHDSITCQLTHFPATVFKINPKSGSKVMVARTTCSHEILVKTLNDDGEDSKQDMNTWDQIVKHGHSNDIVEFLNSCHRKVLETLDWNRLRNTRFFPSSTTSFSSCRHLLLQITHVLRNRMHYREDVWKLAFDFGCKQV